MSAVKMIYAGIRALGIEEEDDRRDLYQRITGKRRLREMTPAEKNAVVSELRRLGFKVAAPPRKLDGPFAKKLQALWIAGWNLGLIRSADDAALLAFIKRQTGIDHPRWLRDPKRADKAIEALKAWTARDGGVMWGNTQGFSWLRLPGARVAWAQWRKIRPEATLTQWQPFSAVVLQEMMGGQRANLDALTAADWRNVNNALGEIIRGAK